MQALENGGMQQDDVHMNRYRMPNNNRWLAFETNSWLSFYLYKILNFDAIVHNLLSVVQNGKFVNSEDANK
jgi:hypothetical protein